MIYSSKPKFSTLHSDEIQSLHDNALQTLRSLITPAGIYASSDNGWRGPYHSWFGRDGAITTDFVCAAVAYGGNKELAETALEGLLALSQWQGKTDIVATGEERGKLPHEIRNSFNAVDRVQHARGTNQKPWFIDPKDRILKNWDSVDSTLLWVIVVIRAHRVLEQTYSQETLRSLRLALEWIINNINQYDGLVGFMGADELPERRYSGLHNQGWKDTFQIYQDSNGQLAKHPIKDVLVNAEGWAALRLGGEVFSAIDEKFARRLEGVAALLKRRFNMEKHGFLLPTKEYFAQAIDGRGDQLTQISADVGMSLWAYVGQESIFEKSYTDVVVDRIMQPSMLNPIAGVRNYEEGTVFNQIGTHYHGTSYTYWPFVSGLIARGCDHFSYKAQATEIIKSSLNAVHHLGSDVELFTQMAPGKFTVWHHPKVGQESSAEQAWTAAAVYYGSLYLLGKTED